MRSIRANSSDVYGFVCRLVGGRRPIADDIFQDVWLAAIDQIEQCDSARGRALLVVRYRSSSGSRCLA